MISFFYSEKSSNSDDDSDYEPDVELCSEERKSVTLNHEEKTEAKSRTRSSQNLSEANLYYDNKSKEVKKSDVNIVEAKNQADCVYKNFLEEAATEMKLLQNECFSSKIISSEVNTVSSVDIGCSKESYCCSLNVIPVDVNETTKNISSPIYNVKNFKSDLSTNTISSLEKNSTTLSPLSTMKRRDLRSVMGNVLKKRKKETILSMSKQDWQKFKEEEDIADELKTYNQGKKGYLERKRFLERSDLRSFQIEREMRLSKKQRKE